MTGERADACDDLCPGPSRRRRALLLSLKEAALSTTYVSMGSRRTSSPHEYYRYPARFPPAFAGAAIDAFTGPGQLVLDPFVGGGTTLVEARLRSRPAVGADLNPLAAFVSSVKTRPLSDRSLEAVLDWRDQLRQQPPQAGSEDSLGRWVDAGYLRNADDDQIAPVTALLGGCLDSLVALTERGASDLARCAILRAGQWALDMRSEIPDAEAVLDSLIAVTGDMVTAGSAYAVKVREADTRYMPGRKRRRTLVIQQGVPGLANRLSGKIPAPALVLTSPPYPGVYVNYHRWKVRGRRETPAPYWLANRQDGNGLAYYTMAARSDRSLATYFLKLEAAFADVAELCDRNTIVMQMVGFHNPARDLPRYLAAMEHAGLEEVSVPTLATAQDGRLWRTVPNRRWWATTSPEYRTAAEVVLVHLLK